MPNGQVPQADPNAKKRWPTLRDRAGISPPAAAVPTQPDAQQALQPPVSPAAQPAPPATQPAVPTTQPTAPRAAPPTTPTPSTAVPRVAAKALKPFPALVKRMLRSVAEGERAEYSDPHGRIEAAIARLMRTVDPDVMKKQREIALGLARWSVEDRVRWRHFGPRAMDLMTHAADVGGDRQRAVLEALSVQDQVHRRDKLADRAAIERTLVAKHEELRVTAKRLAMTGMATPGEAVEQVEGFLDDPTIRLFGSDVAMSRLARVGVGLEAIAPVSIMAQTDPQARQQMLNTVWEGVESNRFVIDQACNGIGVMADMWALSPGSAKLKQKYRALVDARAAADQPMGSEERFQLFLETVLPPASWAAIGGVTRSDSWPQAAAKLREEGTGLNAVYLGSQLAWLGQELVYSWVNDGVVSPGEGVDLAKKCHLLANSLDYTREIGALSTHMLDYMGSTGGPLDDMMMQQLVKAAAMGSVSDVYSIRAAYTHMQARRKAQVELDATLPPPSVIDAYQAMGELGKIQSYVGAVDEYPELLDLNTPDRRMVAEELKKMLAELEGE